MSKTLRPWFVAGGLLGFVVGSMFFASSPADADRTVVLSTAAARITHGDWQRLEDGGFRFTVCGATDLTSGGLDGGRALAVEEPCITCEPGGWNSAPTTCRNAWRAANGL